MKHLWIRTAIVAVILILFFGCTRPIPEATATHAQPEAETLSRTEFAGRVENYFEYESLHAGKASPFRIHLTDMSDGSPVENAEVTLAVRGKGSGDAVVQTTARVGKVTGIYVAELNIPQAGNYDIE